MRIIRFSVFSLWALFFLVACEEEAAPKVQTTSVIVSGTSAEVSGFIVSTGDLPITQFGISISSVDKNPNLDSSPGPFYHKINSKAFSMSVSQLEPATVYYVRAYAINKLGIGYGKTITFTTD